MSEPVILFVKPKAIRPNDKRALKDAGVIVIEVAEPSEVKLTRAGYELEGSAMLRAAAEAIKNCGTMNSPREAFGRAICAAILETKQNMATNAE